jgi:antitoxin component YwqK of YwqJK toxin-antitoxin module
MNYNDHDDSCALVYPPDEFSGMWRENWPNGGLRYQGHFEQFRKREGQHVFFWESGLLHEVSYWREGWAVGTLITYYENGVRQHERDFGEDGCRSRSWVEKSYGIVSGELHTVTIYRHGRRVEQWKDKATAAMWEAIGGDESVKEFAKKYFG